MSRGGLGCDSRPAKSQGATASSLSTFPVRIVVAEEKKDDMEITCSCCGQVWMRQPGSGDDVRPGGLYDRCFDYQWKVEVVVRSARRLLAVTPDDRFEMRARLRHLSDAVRMYDETGEAHV